MDKKEKKDLVKILKTNFQFSKNPITNYFQIGRCIRLIDILDKYQRNIYFDENKPNELTSYQWIKIRNKYTKLREKIPSIYSNEVLLSLYQRIKENN